MNNRIARARPLGRALTATLAAAGLAAALCASTAFAQQPAKKPAPAAKPAAQPAQPAQPPQQAPGQEGQAQPQLMYSPWTKICNKNAETNNKQVCVLIKDGRLENGMPVAMVQLIEPEGQPKLMRVIVPLGMQIQPGTRMIIDQGQPATAQYSICFPVGCQSDYPITDDVIKQMKQGKTLTLQAINMQSAPISLPLPLTDFAKAYDGPPTDPKVLEAQQQKLQSELQKKAEEARKKLEQQPATPPK
jgi:invasion protein IalB